MNEAELSNDINKIELEIQWHKENAGRSVWEIGRRLSHVKENDLAHGQFQDWVEEKLNINIRSAQRFMKVSKELPKTTTWSHLGNRALYLIATLPEEEREKEHELDSGETKAVDEMTTRELEEVNRKNREQEQIIEEKDRQLEETNKKLEEERNKEPKEVTKTEYRVPPEYEGYKSDFEQVSSTLKEVRAQNEKLQEENETMQKEYNRLINERSDVDEKSKKYEELTQSIQDMEGQMTKGQQRIKAQKDVYDLVRKANELTVEVSPLTYLIDTENVLKNEYAQKPIRKIIDNFRDMADRLERSTQQEILEGEIINE